MAAAILKEVLAFATDEACWQALVKRDPAADGAFFYSVRTTGIYCRPGCAARLANRKNVDFHATCQEAERAGFRPCKRCRPNQMSFADRRASAVVQACRLIESATQPVSLEVLAKSVGMSAYHFHRVFKSQTGITPRAYAVALRNERTRNKISKSDSVTSAIFKSGYNSNSRFYESSNSALGMTPSTFRAEGLGATIRFAVGDCWLGKVLVAATDIGVCAIFLGDDPTKLVQALEERFPKAELVGGDEGFEQLVAQVIEFMEKPFDGIRLPLDIQGTAFQQRVWKALGEIPLGQTATYTEIATRLGQPNAVRAVAHACAENPLAVAIPCHRVIRSDGTLAGYRWGIERKQQLLERERKISR